MNNIINQTNALLQTPSDQYTQDQYNLLVETINYHTNLYHLEQAPIISDYDYDVLFDLCIQVESAHPDWTRADSPTHRVGSDIQDGFEQAPHLTPLLSLENSYNAEDLRDRQYLNSSLNYELSTISF
jgi:DNA ligase (NAD+)